MVASSKTARMRWAAKVARGAAPSASARPGGTAQGAAGSLGRVIARASPSRVTTSRAPEFVRNSARAAAGSSRLRMI